MKIKEAARYLRKNRTKSEAILWQFIKNRKLNGKKFLRQHPIKFKYLDRTRYFIADFYCAESKLVIELDGKIHENQREQDEYRTQIINQFGIQVLRFLNEELSQIGDVINRIKEYLD
jgi:very-short-patch-repair endonuclease